MLSICACSKEDPNPEARDPIYDDLTKRMTEHQKNVDEAKAKIAELSDKLEKAEPNTIEKRDMERDLAKARHMLTDSDQWARYYKIRSERRKIVDKLVYKEAFAAKKDWPDPHEYSDYMTNRRLVEINRNWNARVPKLTDRLPSSAKKTEKPKEEGKKEE
jgi:hypothetical protein